MMLFHIVKCLVVEEGNWHYCLWWLWLEECKEARLSVLGLCQVRSGQVYLCWSSPFIVLWGRGCVVAASPDPSEPPVKQWIHVICCVWEKVQVIMYTELFLINFYLVTVLVKRENHTSHPQSPQSLFLFLVKISSFTYFIYFLFK